MQMKRTREDSDPEIPMNKELSDNELKYVTGGKDPLPGYDQERSNTSVITAPGIDSTGK